MENYRVPKRLLGQPGRFGPIARKLPPVFRDRDELAAGADLGDAVAAALQDASTLIVICSPRSAASQWVNEEIRTFIALGRRADMLCLIVDGEPHAADPARECLPPALFENGGIEPLAADIRKGQDGKASARLKILSTVLGVSYDELRQREAARRQKRLALLATGLAIGFVVMAGLTVFALISRNEAIYQRDVARQRTITAERTVSFVKSMFELSDPSEAQGSTVTAREILDRGAKQIRQGLNDEPAVKTELGITLGEVYGSLGLFRQSDALVRWTFGIRHNQPDVMARQLLALGDSSRRMGNYEASIPYYTKAIALERRKDSLRSDLLPRTLVGLAEAYSAVDRLEDADRLASEALKLHKAQLGADHPEVARDLEVLGLNAYYGGDYDRAQPLVAQALAIRMKREGVNSPSVSDDMTTLGSIALAKGDMREAERYFRSRLAIDERVMGTKHPDVAISLNNIARVLLERRAYREAEPMLERAVAINLKERGGEHDDLLFANTNLAIVKAGLGRTREAITLFERALAVARTRKHRLLGPILSDLAALRCGTGKPDTGLPMLAEARRVMAADYPDQLWRTAWVDNIRGDCLRRAGQLAEGTALIARSSPVILKRWGPETHYGQAAVQRQRGPK